MLDSFGVSPEAELLYQALVRAPGAGVREACAGMSPAVASGAVAELEACGLVARRDSGHVEVLPPERALTSLVEIEEARIAARTAALARSREAIGEIVESYVAPRAGLSGEHLELLVDPELVRTRIYQLAQAATTSVWAVHPGPALTEPQIAAALVTDRDIAERGLDCRMILTPASLGPPHWEDYLAELQGLGHQLRMHEAAGQVCLLFDGRVAVIPSTTGKPPFGAYVLRGAALVAPVVALFREHWAAGAPVLPLAESEAAVSEVRVRQVVALLARGMKDDAIARRLGVSTRTMRRLVAATLEELQADSRFQAGIEATRRGWVE